MIGGPGAFYVAARDFDAFASAILAKLIREIAGLESRRENTVPLKTNQLLKAIRLYRRCVHPWALYLGVPMKELRCIVFTERELTSAVIGRRRKRNEELPQGTVELVKFRTGDTIETVMEVKDDYGRITSLVLPEQEVAAALIAFCMGRRFPCRWRRKRRST